MRYFFGWSALAFVAFVLWRMFGEVAVVETTCPFVREERHGPGFLHVDVRGTRFDVAPDVSFTGSVKHVRLNQQASLLDFVVPDGPEPIDLHVTADMHLIVRFAGAVERLARIQLISHGDYWQVGEIGVPAAKVAIAASEPCVRKARTAALPTEEGPSGPIVLRQSMRIAWPEQPGIGEQCQGLACAATPISWPRKIDLPTIVPIDMDAVVASTPVWKPPLLTGWAGFSQLISRGDLRFVTAEEEADALAKVRAKYVSRFTPEWRPRFGIDFVMIRPTALPTEDHFEGWSFRGATVLVPDHIRISRTDPNHCLVVMGPLAEERGGTDDLREVQSPPPYLVSSWAPKCLGLDQSPGPSPFHYADRVPPSPPAKCRAATAGTEQKLIGIVALNSAPLSPDPYAFEAALIRLKGTQPVVLVGRKYGVQRRWKIEEAFPGQVTALILLEAWSVVNPQIYVDGVPSDRVWVPWPRLGRRRNVENTEWLPPIEGYNSFDWYPPCLHFLVTLSWYPHLNTTTGQVDPGWFRHSVSERGFDESVRVLTGRNLDQLVYAKDEPVTIMTDAP